MNGTCYIAHKSGQENRSLTINAVSPVEQTDLGANSELERDNLEKSQQHTPRKIIPTKQFGDDKIIEKKEKTDCCKKRHIWILIIIFQRI